MSALPETVELFSGEATTAEARVYARIQSDDPAERNSSAIRISGQLIGPVCEFSQTLPAKHQFIEFQGTDRQPAALAQAIVPDPCFWTPELPFLYRAELQLHIDGEIATVNRIVGIRRLGMRGKSLFFDGKRFVLRGWQEGRMQNAECKLFLERHQEFLRETWTALVVANPDDEVCEFASRRGILLVADLIDEGDSPIDSLRRVARWPAVSRRNLGRWRDDFSEPNRRDSKFAARAIRFGGSKDSDRAVGRFAIN